MAAECRSNALIREGQRVRLTWEGAPLTGVVDHIGGGFAFVKLDELYRNSGFAAARLSQVKPE